MRGCLGLATALCLLGFASQAMEADPVVPECWPGALRLESEGPELSDLWAWVRAEAGVADDAPLPEICRVTPADLQRLNSEALLTTVAVYDRPRRRILLTAPWDPADPVDQSMIVHELVHHAQTVAERRFACPALAEAEAYDAQEKWLALTGGDLESAFGIDRLTRLLLGNCFF